MIDFNLLKEILTKNNSFLITTHVNPDADAIGSEIALYFILKKLGKEIYIINHSVTPYNLEFLDEDKQIQKFDAARHTKLFKHVDVLFAVDFNRSDRTVSMQKYFNESDRIKICIDHHQEPEDFVTYKFVDQEYSATGQIIFDLIKKTNIVPLDRQTAYPIYAAIMTDTGSFRFERTTPEIHQIAGELIQHDVKPNEVYDKIYDQSKFSKIKLMGRALNSMQLYGEGNQIGFMKLSREDFTSTNAFESDTDSFVNYSLSVEGVKIGLLFIELKEGFKVSFRSKGNIAVNKLAAEFGGGGHINAAGARILNYKLNDMLPKILSRAEKYIENSKE